MHVRIAAPDCAAAAVDASRRCSTLRLFARFGRTNVAGGAASLRASPRCASGCEATSSRAAAPVLCVALRYHARMGLDTVELVMEIEEEFGITFPDAAAEHCRTVNEVALYVYGRIEACPTSSTKPNTAVIRFQELRRDIAEISSVEPDSIHPESLASEAIPRGIRRKFWSRSKVPLPDLHRPNWAYACIALIGTGTFAIVAVPLGSGSVDLISTLILAAAVAVVATFAAILCLRPFKRELPANISTIDDLARGTFRHSKKYEPLPGEATFPQVLLRIRQITADQMGLPIEKVFPRSRFVEDLEMD